MIRLVCIAKNEGPYIRDWCEHHLRLGFDQVLIFNNGETPYNIDDARVIELQWTSTQIPCYNFYIQSIAQENDWTLICDVDEYLILKEDDTIQNFINSYNGADAILLNWKVYGDNGLDNYENKPVMERFKEPAPIDCVYNDTLPQPVTENWHVKSLFKKTNKRMGYGNPHNIMIEGGVIVHESGRVIDSSPWVKPEWRYAWINHYMIKSRQEWIDRRLNKKDACGNKIDEYKLKRWYKNLNRRSV